MAANLGYEDPKRQHLAFGNLRITLDPTLARGCPTQSLVWIEWDITPGTHANLGHQPPVYFGLQAVLQGSGGSSTKLRTWIHC